MRASWAVVPLLLAGVLAGCDREPPDITEAEAKTIAEKEMPKWCDTEGFHCSDFRSIGAQKPAEPDFEWAYHWLADKAARPALMIVLVSKKGVPAVRVMPAPPSGDDSAAAAATSVAAASPPPNAPLKAPAAGAAPKPVEGASKAPSAAVLASTRTASGVKGGWADSGKAATTTPAPPVKPSKPVEPTFTEVSNACVTEIGILCLKEPSTVARARECLRPHRAALRNSCGKIVGLKKWP